MIKRYEGIECSLCHKSFVKDDEIVVCPDCGTPYHKKCYNEVGECLFKDKHGDGFEFKVNDTVNSTESIENTIEEKEDFITCPVCMAKNGKYQRVCTRCGSNLNTNSTGSATGYNQFFESMISNFSNEEKVVDGINGMEVASYVQASIPYYLHIFKRINNYGTSKFNFSAFLFSGVWFLYRKQYKIGAIITGIMVVLTLASTIIQGLFVSNILTQLFASAGITDTSQMTNLFRNYDAMQKVSQEVFSLPIGQVILFFLPTIIMILQFVVMIVCGTIANKMYMKQCITDINSIKNTGCSQEIVCEKLKFKGGINLRLALAILASVIILNNLITVIL